MAGRPSSKFEVNLNKIDESLENIKVFASNSRSRESQETQTSDFLDVRNPSPKEVPGLVPPTLAPSNPTAFKHYTGLFY